MPCLLHLVPLTVATIHLYLAADAPNHSILPLIHLNSTPLEESTPDPHLPTQHPLSKVHPGMHSVDPSIHPYFHSSLHPWVRVSVCLSSHPYARLSFIHSPRLGSTSPPVRSSGYQTVQYVELGGNFTSGPFSVCSKKADYFHIDQHISFG